MTPPGARSGAAGGKRKRTNADRLAEQVRVGQRRAGRRACPTCGADTLHGLDGDVLAFTVTADARGVGATEELHAWSAGRASFLARRDGAEVELERRDVHQLRAHPAGTTTHPVLLEHRCEEHPPPPPPPPLFELAPGHDIGTTRRDRVKTERATS